MSLHKQSVSHFISMKDALFLYFVITNTSSDSISGDLNQPGETGPPELLSSERPESESMSSRACGSKPPRQCISWVSMVSRLSKPSWLIWSNTASSRQPPSTPFPVKLQTEAKGRAARPRAIPGNASECEELVDSCRRRALRCWVASLGSALSDGVPKAAVLVTMASWRLTSWLMALAMSVSMSDRRPVTRGSKSCMRWTF